MFPREKGASTGNLSISVRLTRTKITLPAFERRASAIRTEFLTTSAEGYGASWRATVLFCRSIRTRAVERASRVRGSITRSIVAFGWMKVVPMRLDIGFEDVQAVDKEVRRPTRTLVFDGAGC